MKWRGVVSAIIFSFLISQYCFAEEYVSLDKYEQLEKRVKALEEKLSEQSQLIQSQNTLAQAQQQKISEYEAKLSRFDEKLHREEGVPIKLIEGFDIGAGATMVVQGTNNVNVEDNTKKSSRTDGSYSADITIGKEFQEISGKAFLHLEAGQGAGLEDDLTLFSNVNRDADDDQNVRVAELWYEQALFKDRVALTFGKIDPTVYFDNNEVANDETTQFLSNMFKTNSAIEFPDNTVALRAAVMPVDWLELNYGAFNTNGNWDEIADNLFHVGQVTFKTNFFDLPGNYRFLGWQNRAHHTKWLDMEKQKEDMYGFALSFDQKVHDIVTLFARYGWQDPKVFNPDIMASGDLNYSLKQSWSTGLEIEGKPWHRENDVIAFAVGQVIPSKDYKRAFDPELNCKDEGHLEAYYRIHINDHLSISPDLQYIWDPFGKDIADDTNSVFVGGMRAQVDF